MQAYPRIHDEVGHTDRGEDQGSEAWQRRDHELMAALRGGSTAALEELMAVYWAPLVRWAARELDDLDTAQDVVQQVFVQIWQHRARWVSRGSPRAYLFRVTRSLLIDECRRRNARWRRLLRNGGSELRHVATPAEELDTSRLWHAYQLALAKLPPRKREVYLLVYVQGLSHAEVAETMDISQQTVANQVTDALRQLRKSLSPLIGTFGT